MSRVEGLSKWAHFEQKRFEYLDANLRHLKGVESDVNEELARIKYLVYKKKNIVVNDAEDQQNGPIRRSKSSRKNIDIAVKYQNTEQKDENMKKNSS